MSKPYNKKLCIICQIENKNILYCVQTLQMGDKMLSVAQKLSNKGFIKAPMMSRITILAG